MTSQKVWLDDIRRPPDDSWVVLTNGVQFYEWLNTIYQTGQIDFISFDHDLGDDSPNGSTLARALVNRCLDYGIVIPSWSCHSSNPDGRKNIESVMRSGVETQIRISKT